MNDMGQSLAIIRIFSDFGKMFDGIKSLNLPSWFYFAVALVLLALLFPKIVDAVLAGIRKIKTQKLETREWVSKALLEEKRRSLEGKLLEAQWDLLNSMLKDSSLSEPTKLTAVMKMTSQLNKAKKSKKPDAPNGGTKRISFTPFKNGL